MPRRSRRHALRWIGTGLAAVAGTLLAGGTGCVSETPSNRHKLVWRTLSRGLTSGLVEPRREVLRDEAEFFRVWAEHAAEVARPALPPKVDFAKEMVVLVAMGQRPTGGFFIEVVDVELHGRTLEIRISERVPKPGTYQLQQVTQPFQFIALPGVQARIRFRNVQEAAPRRRSSPVIREPEPTRRVVPSKVTPAPTRSPRGANP